MEILSSLKKQPNINEAVLRVSRPLSSFQSTLEVTASYPTTGKQSRPRRWETAITWGQACVRGGEGYCEKVEERRRKGQTHHQWCPRTPLTLRLQAKYVPYRSCALTIPHNLGSAKETGYLDGHFVQDQLRPTIRRFTSDSENRDKDCER